MTVQCTIYFSFPSSFSHNVVYLVTCCYQKHALQQIIDHDYLVHRQYT